MKANTDYSHLNTIHTAQEKIRIAELRKEIDSLNQGFEKCFWDGGYDNCFKALEQKHKECQAFRELFVQKYYDSPDTTIALRIFIDLECKEVKKFSIKDRKNKVEKDSFYYDNGHWEVTESYWLEAKDGKMQKIYKIKGDGGGEDITIRDEQGRITDNLFIGKNNDTLRREQYFWQNGRLVRTIMKGVERNFIYGSPCDSIIVDPPDDSPRGDFSPPPVYHKSFGLIPEESDPEYEEFKRHPYHYANSASLKMLERQKKRCEEYKKSQKKGK